MRIIAVDIGGTEIKGALFDNVLLTEYRIKTDSKKGLNVVLLNLKNVINNLWDGDVCAIGIVTAGAIDIKTGQIVKNFGTIDGWINFSIKDEIEHEYNVPCYIDNDANGAMIAEMDIHKGVKNACMITLGTGVGTAAYLNGELYRGEHYKLEFGHSTLIPNGLKCTCGSFGCAECYLSGTALTKRAKEEVDSAINTGDELFEYYKKGDIASYRIIDEYTDLLALFINNIVHFYDPKLIIIGGGVMHSWEILFDFLNKKIKHLDAKVIPAKLGNFAGIKGAYLLAQKEYKSEKN